MNTVNMPVKRSLKTKTLLMMWFEIFINTLNVLPQITLLKKIKIITVAVFYGISYYVLKQDQNPLN
jgi:hypothetical protein